MGILVALLVALYGGTNGAGAIVTALNIAYEEKEKRTLGQFYLLAMVMTVIAIVGAVDGAGGDDDAGAARQTWRRTHRRWEVGAAKAAGYLGLTIAAAAVAATLYRFEALAGGCALDVDHARLAVRGGAPGCC